MASLLVDIGFKDIYGTLNNVLDSVKKLNGGIKDVVSGTKELNKQLSMAEKGNKLFKDVQKLASYSTIIGNFTNGIKSIVNFGKRGFEGVKNVALEGDRIYKTSKLVGMSVREYQAFGSAARHSGMQISEMDSALRRFNVNLGKAKSGDKTASKMFDSLLPKGMKISDYKNQGELISAIASGYSKLGDAAQKAFVVQELFGRGGAKFGTLLEEGGQGVKKLLGDYNSSGAGYSEKGAELAQEFNDELQITGELLNQFKISVSEDLFPTFIDFFRTIQSYVKANGSELKASIGEAVSAITNFAKDLLPKIPGYLDSIKKIIDYIGPKTVLIGSVFVAMLPAISQIAIGLKGLMSFLGPILKIAFFISKVFWPILEGFKVAAAVLGGGTFIATFGGILVLLVEIGVIVKQIYDNWDMLWSFIKDDVWGGFKNMISDFALKVGDFCSSAADKFLGLFHGLGDVFLGIGESIASFCDGAINKIFGFVQKIRDAFNGIFGSFPDKIKSFFGVQNPLPQSAGGSGSSSLGSSIAKSISESHTTTTSRFAVDFTNMPRGVQVTPPAQGDFDWSRGYVLGGV